MNQKWDKRFLRLSREVAGWSKDPSTQVGSVIVDEKNRVVSLGFNGFPRGIKDTQELYTDREEKYKRVLHAEQNAILFADKSLQGCTLYTYPLSPCSSCALLIIQSGISNVVTVTHQGRWIDSCELAIELFSDSGVNYTSYVKGFLDD